MTKEQFIALGLTEEQAIKAAAASAGELKGFIPKARFDEINTAKAKAVKDAADRDKLLEILRADARASEELKLRIAALLAENKAAKVRHEAEIRDLKVTAGFEKALIDAGFKYPDLLISKVDKSKVEMLQDGTFKGLDDQIELLKKSYKGLLGEHNQRQQQQIIRFKGMEPAEGAKGCKRPGQVILIEVMEDY